ncbi:MAG: immunoglobulin domain-containing protein [Verrucomicrobiales bacterium]|nr:immunoglobulin domain-containing protein [Verrucomicrobiales bacterium]
MKTVVCLLCVWALSFICLGGAIETDSWRIRNPDPHLLDVSSGTFAGELYFAFGRFGAFSVSRNGQDWVAVDSQTSVDIAAVAFGAGRYIAVGAFGEILSSDDGIHWEKEFSGSLGTLYSVAYGNNVFVAVGENILTSFDQGRTWQEFVSGGDGSVLTQVVFGHAGFVVAAPNAGILTSQDGRLWEFQRRPYLSSLAYGNGVYVAMGYRASYTSSDARHWEIHQTPDESAGAACFGASLFVSVGATSIWTSSNGTSWTEAFKTDRGEVRILAHGTAGFLMIRYDGSRIQSEDGIHWSASPQSTSRDLSIIIYGQGIFVAAGQGIMTSADGIRWNYVSPPTPARILDIAFLEGVFAAATQDGTVLTSTNGVHWTQSAGYYSISTLAAGNKTFVASGTSVEGTTALWVSKDGKTWEPQIVPQFQTRPLEKAVFADGTFLGQVRLSPTESFFARSSNGRSWEVLPTSSAVGRGSLLAYDRGIFVLRDEANQSLIISTNLQDSVTVPYGSMGVAFFPLVVMGDGGAFFSFGIDPIGAKILQSKDGVHWTDVAWRPPNQKFIRDAIFADSSVFGVGEEGLIIQSPPREGGLPQIVAQPANATASLGGDAQFTVLVSNLAGLEFQWRKDGVPIIGGTNATLLLAGVQASEAGIYVCAVRNSVGEAVSLPALLKIVQPEVGELSIQYYAGITIAGTPGSTYRIDYTTELSSSPSWVTATNLLIRDNHQIWVDLNSVAAERRFYRATRIP